MRYLLTSHQHQVVTTADLVKLIRSEQCGVVRGTELPEHSTGIWPQPQAAS